MPMAALGMSSALYLLIASFLLSFIQSPVLLFIMALEAKDDMHIPYGLGV